MPAKFFQNVNVAEICKRRVIGDDSRKPYLIFAFIDPKRQGIFYRPLGLLARALLCPVRFFRQKAVNRLDLQTIAVVADSKFVLLPFVVLIFHLLIIEKVIVPISNNKSVTAANFRQITVL